MVRPSLYKVIHHESENLSAFYFRHFQELDALFHPMPLKEKPGRLNGILVVEPPPACNASPSISDSLLCEGYINTFRLAEDFLPELPNFIQLQ